jgi:hypothetical protein
VALLHRARHNSLNPPIQSTTPPICQNHNPAIRCGLQPHSQRGERAHPARCARLTNGGPLARKLARHAPDPVPRTLPTRANGPASVSQGQRPWNTHLRITTRAEGPPPLPDRFLHHPDRPGRGARAATRLGPQ